jgi:hypothetical protein
MPTSLDLANLLNTLRGMQVAISHGSAAAAALNLAYMRVQTIAYAGRDPTPLEWDELNRQVASLHRRLQSETMIG